MAHGRQLVHALVMQHMYVHASWNIKFTITNIDQREALAYSSTNSTDNFSLDFDLKQMY